MVREPVYLATGEVLSPKTEAKEKVLGPALQLLHLLSVQVVEQPSMAKSLLGLAPVTPLSQTSP